MDQDKIKALALELATLTSIRKQWEKAVSLAIEQRPKRLALSVTCEVLGLNRSSVCLRRKGLVGDKAKRCCKQSVQPRALSAQERESVRDTLRSEDYRNQPPAEVYERLLESCT